MQASLAFMKVESAFAFCITSYAKIAEWRAVMNRVAQFEAAMAEVDQPGLAGASLDIAGSAARDLSIKELVRAASDRRADRIGARARSRARPIDCW